MDQSVRTNWESYWNDLPRESGLPVWDSAGAVTATAQAPLFHEYFAADLPVLDIGCGNGTQTAALATQFARAVGLDFAPSAIEHARTLQADSAAEFRVFDLTDTPGATALHSELGDANVYMRGVLHQMPDPARPAAAASLRELIGDTGHVFAVELSPAAADTIQTALAASPTAVPKLKRVFQYGLTPAAWQDGKLESVVDGAGLEILATGPITLHATDTLPDGSVLDLPMVYVVARARR